MDRIENSVHLGYLHRPTCTLFFLCFITFPSVVCFRCRKRPLYRRERGKVFGLNTLRRRKIQSETACSLTFSLSEESVLTKWTATGISD